MCALWVYHVRGHLVHALVRQLTQSRIYVQIQRKSRYSSPSSGRARLAALAVQDAPEVFAVSACPPVGKKLSVSMAEIFPAAAISRNWFMLVPSRLAIFSRAVFNETGNRSGNVATRVIMLPTPSKHRSPLAGGRLFAVALGAGFLNHDEEPPRQLLDAIGLPPFEGVVGQQFPAHADGARSGENVVQGRKLVDAAGSNQRRRAASTIASTTCSGVSASTAIDTCAVR